MCTVTKTFGEAVFRFRPNNVVMSSNLVAARALPARPAVERTAYEVVRTPVLVVGAGAAGLRTAIELADRGHEPLVIGKRGHGDAHTVWAAGGINAALGTHDPEDDWTVHAADTHVEGHHINDPAAVATVAEEMPERVRELAEWGMDFDRTDGGRINQRYFGAQSFRRTCFVGDRTGAALLETLVEQAKQRSVPYRENLLITRLLAPAGRVEGAVGVDLETGDFVVFATDEIVLAAGGYSALYNRHSSRAEENNGDGPVLAFEAGAQLQDIEFVQFHPTGMVGDRYGAAWDGRLVTEAVRGEGGRLFNGAGDRFMKRYAPDQMELDARDVVARAIDEEVAAGRGSDHGGAYLDISHREAAFIEERLPRMDERFEELGVDLAAEPVEVAPTAHYSMGGVAIDFETGATGVPGLSAVGETVAGVHGANRLGGNSLAETVAVGVHVGAAVAESVEATTDPALSAAAHRQARQTVTGLRALEDRRGDPDLTPAVGLERLGAILEDHAGIRRDHDGLTRGQARLADLQARAETITVEGDRTSRAFEYAVDLSFGLVLGEVLLEAATRRSESRGAHYRRDHPAVDDAWRQNIVVTDAADPRFETRAVGAPSPAVQTALDAGYELDYHHLE